MVRRAQARSRNKINDMINSNMVAALHGASRESKIALQPASETQSGGMNRDR